MKDKGASGPLFCVSSSWEQPTEDFEVLGWSQKMLTTEEKGA